jgi:hypothetical protein
MLEHHRVAGDQRRNHRVDRCHVGVVPGRDDEDHTMRLAHDPALELCRVLDLDRRQRPRGNLGHVVAALVDAAELAAVAHRPAHHPGQFRHDFVAHLVETRDTGLDQCDTLFQRPSGPVLLRLARPRDGGCRIIVQAHDRTLGIDRTVNRRYQFQTAHCLVSFDRPEPMPGQRRPSSISVVLAGQARSKPRAISQSVTALSNSSCSHSAQRT